MEYDHSKTRLKHFDRYIKDNVKHTKLCKRSFSKAQKSVIQINTSLKNSSFIKPHSINFFLVEKKTEIERNNKRLLDKLVAISSGKSVWLIYFIENITIN